LCCCFEVDSRHMPMCMSGAAVLKQSANYFNRTEYSSLIQMSLTDELQSQQVVASLISNLTISYSCVLVQIYLFSLYSVGVICFIE